MGKLEGKTVLITGASRGIGLAIAQALDREGARLILVGLHPGPLARATQQVPGAVMSMPVDVTKPGDVKRLFAAVKKQVRRLDVLINNAGVFTFQTLCQNNSGGLEAKYRDQPHFHFPDHPGGVAAAQAQPGRCGEYPFRFQPCRLSELFGVFRRRSSVHWD